MYAKTEKIPDYLLATVLAATNAGHIISRTIIYNQPKEIRNKDGALITKTDIEAHTAIVKTLQEELTESGYNYLSEEEGDIKRYGNSDYLWVIDPLDGTIPFANNIPTSVVIIGVINIKEKTIAAGVVYDPIKRHLYLAEKNKDTVYFCTVNGKVVSNSDDINTLLTDEKLTIKLTTHKAAEEKRSTLSRVYSTYGMKQSIEACEKAQKIYINFLAETIKEGILAKELDSAGYAAMRVAVNDAVGCLYSDTKAWDNIGTAAILWKANKVLFDIHTGKLMSEKNLVERTLAQPRGPLPLGAASDEATATLLFKLYQQALSLNYTSP